MYKYWYMHFYLYTFIYLEYKMEHLLVTKYQDVCVWWECDALNKNTTVCNVHVTNKDNQPGPIVTFIHCFFLRGLSSVSDVEDLLTDVSHLLCV